MSNIRQLTASDTVVGGDKFATYKDEHGDTRRVTAAALLAYMQANLVFTAPTVANSFTTNFAAPVVSGFAVAVTDGVTNDTNIHLILAPTGAFAAGTVNLPPVANSADKQEILVNSTQAVTALSVTSSGSSVSGAPTTLTAGGFFRMKYDVTTNSWYRVG